MDTSNPTVRPDVIDTLTSHQLGELEVQVDEYDREEFERVSQTYGWDRDTIESVWNWFAVRNNYPLPEEFGED